MRVEQGEHAQQPILSLKRHGSARIVGRQADAGVGQRDQFRP